MSEDTPHVTPIVLDSSKLQPYQEVSVCGGKETVW